MKKEHKRPIDKNGKEHGYWERYWNDDLWYKGSYIHGKPHGYWEIYNSFQQKLENKRYYII